MLKDRKHRNTILLGFILTLIVAAIINPEPGVIKSSLERIEGIIYDLRLNLTLPKEQRPRDHNIFIVDIDEKSLNEIGRWPWSRKTIATLVDNLLDAGVIVVGFDVIFSEPERNPVDTVLQQHVLSPPSQNELQALREALDADTRFARSLTDNDVVLGVLFQQDRTVDVGELSPSPINLAGFPSNQLLSLSFPGKVSNIDQLRNEAIGQGFINSSPDPDGYIRRAALVIEHKGQMYPSLALEVARLYTLVDEFTLTTEALGFTNKRSIISISDVNRDIPTDEYGRVLVPYRGDQRSFPYYSAVDIINQAIPAELLEGGVALVGTSSVGIADLRATSVGLQYPGVEVHANVLEGILNPTLLSSRPDWAQGALTVQVLFFGLILSYFLPYLGPLAMAFFGGLSLSVVLGFNLYMWHYQQYALPITQPLLLVFVLTFYNLARGFFSENANKQQIKSMFDQYVPPAHIEKMLDDPNSVSLEGERKEMSVLFSDIRNFTSISESLSANDLKAMLNEYFSPITQAIFEHNGTIDKYVGDMVMAFWGAPMDDPQHAENAVITGFEMLTITAKLRDEFKAKGWPEVRVGIGINTGDMNVGDMGSVYRRSYTVLGDAVNLGSRLEGLTKFYGVEFLVSEFTKKQCPNIIFRVIDRVKVKGKDKAVAIFEPVCQKQHVSEMQIKELTLLDHAYQDYLNQNWLAATEKYTELAQQHPNTKLYSIYLERISQLKTMELEESWDGSFTHTSK